MFTMWSQDGQLVRRLLDHLGLRLLSPDAVVLEGVMPLLEKLGEATHGEQELGETDSGINMIY